MKKQILFLLMLLPSVVVAQWLPFGPWSVCATNTATMLPPASITAVLFQPVHPGLSVSYEFGWRDKEFSKWFQDAGIGYTYHRFAYQSVVINTKAGYRRYLGNLSLEAALQAGYMHMFLLTDRAVWDDDHWTSKAGFGKPQFITGAGVGIGYDIGTEDAMRRIILNYDFRLQMPFVKNYTPLLPSGLLSLGLQFTL
ncbi:MAG TPA: hypothetical protein PLP88_04745 [Bacteroidales bacterium]|nr:hypothetical protein [Bacteroidales bacterium]